jgi:hypothetical protein
METHTFPFEYDFFIDSNTKMDTKLLKVNIIEKEIEKLGGRKLNNTDCNYRDIYAINGIQVEIYEMYTYDKPARFKYHILGDEGERIQNSEGILFNVKDIINQLPNENLYLDMKKPHIDNLKIRAFGNIENADNFYNEYMKMFINSLYKLEIKFVDDSLCRFKVNEVPVEITPLIGWSNTENPIYLCYVIDKFGRRTEFIHRGNFFNIINELMDKEEYEARFGAEGKYAGLKK